MKYQRKQAEVDAVLFDPKVFPWPAGVTPYSISLPLELNHMGRLVTKLGIVPVSSGDWIVTYSDGTRDALSDAEFKEAYEPAKE